MKVSLFFPSSISIRLAVNGRKGPKGALPPPSGGKGRSALSLHPAAGAGGPRGKRRKGRPSKNKTKK